MVYINREGSLLKILVLQLNTVFYSITSIVFIINAWCFSSPLETLKLCCLTSLKVKPVAVKRAVVLVSYLNRCLGRWCSCLVGFSKTL